MGLGDGMGWINIANNNNAMQNNEPIQEQHLHSLRFITHCNVVVLFFYLSIISIFTTSYGA